MLRLAALPLLAALLLAALQPVRPAVLGIDVGGQNLKVRTTPQRSPLRQRLSDLARPKLPPPPRVTTRASLPHPSLPLACWL